MGGTTNAYRLLYLALESSETYEFTPGAPLTLAGSVAINALTTTATTVNVMLIGREEV